MFETNNELCEIIQKFCDDDEYDAINSTSMYEKLLEYLLNVAKQRAEKKLYMMVMIIIIVRRMKHKFIDNYYKPFGKLEQKAKLKFDLLKKDN